jgi:hypothetical protein
MKAGVLLMPIIVSQDGCIIDGNARRSINPILCNDWAEYHNQPWAGVLIGYLPSYGKNDKPRDLGADLWQSCKRRLHADAMAEILRHVRELEETGVRMELPGGDGTFVELTVVPVLAFGSYDNPETKRVSGVKDHHENMPMFCVM